MPNCAPPGGFRPPPALTSRFQRQVPQSGEELPPRRPCHICENAKYASQLPFSRDALRKRTGLNDGFSGRLHRL